MPIAGSVRRSEAQDAQPPVGGRTVRRSGTMFKNLRTASDEMILAEALIYFVFIGTLALGATLATALIR